MSEHEALAPRSRGCLAVLAGVFSLALISPFAFVVQRWRRRRRGNALRSTVEVRSFEKAAGVERRCIDVTLDVPVAVEPGFRRRVTEAIVRVADTLRRPDDVYNVIYSPPGDTEPVVLPVGPQLQELGERFFLTLTQSALSARTVVWLTLGRDHPLSEVVDPMTCDPEAEGEPESILSSTDARWSMATEWVRVGPSLVIRLIIVVPAETADEVKRSVEALC